MFAFITTIFLLTMGNQQVTAGQTKTTFSRENLNDVQNVGYPIYPGKFSLTAIANKDHELSTCIKNLVTMFDYQVEVTHDDNKIIDPIVIHNKMNNDNFKLYQLNYDFYHVPEQDKYSKYILKVNDVHTYKFPHISNVQFYFETINNKFARL